MAGISKADGCEVDTGRESRGRGGTLSGWLALGIVLIYAGAGAAMFVLPRRLYLLIIVAHFVFYLVVYVGAPGAAVAWLVAMLCRLFVFKQRRGLVWTGVKYGVICFGLMGICFGVLAFTVPGYVTMSAGFWIHMKVWTDVEAIRSWGVSCELDGGESETLSKGSVFIDRDRWPRSIRWLGPNMVVLGLKDRSVNLVYGGGFGHWGLTVGPKRTGPFGEFTILLEDGAWVWHEIQ